MFSFRLDFIFTPSTLEKKNKKNKNLRKWSNLRRIRFTPWIHSEIHKHSVFFITNFLTSFNSFLGILTWIKSTQGICCPRLNLTQLRASWHFRRTPSIKSSKALKFLRKSIATVNLWCRFWLRIMFPINISSSFQLICTNCRSPISWTPIGTSTLNLTANRRERQAGCFQRSSTKCLWR